MSLSRRIGLLLLALVLPVWALEEIAGAADPWVVYPGGPGPGQGKHIVLVSGDEEYRSEEALPQLGKILSQRLGFRCTVLFSINPADGTIDPNNQTNIPGLEALRTADLLVVFLRFRNLPDDQMKHFVDYLATGKPIMGLRTATHSFDLKASKTYREHTWNNGDPAHKGGFGRTILGETWVAHHGGHGSQSTRGIAAPGQADHPILRGIKAGEIWGPTDVYTVNLPLPGDSQPIVLGQVVEGMKPTDKPATGKKNDPMMPVAWTKTYQAGGKPGRVFTTTMGASQDLEAIGTRRMLVNAALWALSMEEAIKPDLNVDIVGEYKPLPFKFGGFKKGVKPADHALPQ